MTQTIKTFEQLKRTCAAFVETEKMLNKELAYPADLQRADKVSFYKAHMVKLATMINNHQVAEA